MTRSVSNRANSLCNRFKRSNKVALFIHSLFSGVVGVSLIICLIKEVSSLSKISNEGFLLSNVIEVNGDICEVQAQLQVVDIFIEVVRD